MSAGRPRRRRGAPRALRLVQSTGPTPPRPRRPSRRCARPPPLRRLRRVRRRGASRRDRRRGARRTGAAARAPGGRRRRALRARRRTPTTTGWATCSLVRPVPVQARGAGTGVRGEAERPACGSGPYAWDTTGHQLRRPVRGWASGDVLWCSPQHLAAWLPCPCLCCALVCSSHSRVSIGRRSSGLQRTRRCE